MGLIWKFEIKLFKRKLELRFSAHKNFILICKIHFDWVIFVIIISKSNIVKIQTKISFTKTRAEKS